jgi:prepilin-type processing-associated H-X9-DG protein
MEQGVVFNTLNFVYNAADRNGWRSQGGTGTRIPGNTTAFHLTLNIVQCPSDGRNALTLDFGHTNYAACMGAIPVTYNLNFDGIFGFCDGSTDPYYSKFIGAAFGKVVSVNDVPDGFSNTAAFSERVKGIGNNENGTVDPLYPSTTYWYFPSIWSYGGGGPNALTLADVPQYYQNCVASTMVYDSTNTPGTPSGAALKIIHLGLFWWQGFTSQGRYNHVMPPNNKFCTAGNENYLEQAFGTSSRHPGGVNECFADGSVKFIKNTVSPPVYWALGSRNGNEVISADQY